MSGLARETEYHARHFKHETDQPPRHGSHQADAQTQSEDDPDPMSTHQDLESSGRPERNRRNGRVDTHLSEWNHQAGR